MIVLSLLAQMENKWSGIGWEEREEREGKRKGEQTTKRAYNRTLRYELGLNLSYCFLYFVVLISVKLYNTFCVFPKIIITR